MSKEVKFPITFVHENTKEKLVARDEVQAAAFKNRGWKPEEKKK